jgi:hypothetical protein
MLFDTLTYFPFFTILYLFVLLHNYQDRQEHWPLCNSLKLLFSVIFQNSRLLKKNREYLSISARRVNTLLQHFLKVILRPVLTLSLLQLCFVLFIKWLWLAAIIPWLLFLGCLMIQHNQLLLAVAVRSLLKPLFSK